jgi:hypothetical protein
MIGRCYGQSRQTAVARVATAASPTPAAMASFFALVMVTSVDCEESLLLGTFLIHVNPCFARAGSMPVMTTRRSFFRASGAVLAMLALPAAHAQQIPLLTVYKSPACGCCGEWVEHMRTNGFRLEVRDLDDVMPIKRQYGVPDALVSCHTAVVAGYAIEGHVPAADVKRLLRERPKLKGLAVPGMVPGSPGMQGTAQPYATMAFDSAGSRIFERH